MKTQAITISLLLLLAMILTPLANAEEDPAAPPAGGPRMGGFRAGPGMAGHGRFLLGPVGKKLGLTDEQKEKIKDIVESRNADTETLKDTTPDAMKALNEAAESGDEAAIAKAAKTLADAFASKAVKNAATAKAIKGVLTEEQNAQLETMKAEIKERIQQRREKGGPAGFQKGPRMNGHRMDRGRIGGGFRGGTGMWQRPRDGFRGGPGMWQRPRDGFRGGTGMCQRPRGGFRGGPGMWQRPRDGFRGGYGMAGPRHGGRYGQRTGQRWNPQQEW